LSLTYLRNCEFQLAKEQSVNKRFYNHKVIRSGEMHTYPLTANVAAKLRISERRAKKNHIFLALPSGSNFGVAKVTKICANRIQKSFFFAEVSPNFI